MSTPPSLCDYWIGWDAYPILCDYGSGWVPSESGKIASVRIVLGNIKLESLVITDQHAAVNMYSGPVHTARHTLGIGFARSIRPMITHDFLPKFVCGPALILVLQLVDLVIFDLVITLMGD
nr:ribosomal protein S10 [Tanacetum cinerariifolium]